MNLICGINPVLEALAAGHAPLRPAARGQGPAQPARLRGDRAAPASSAIPLRFEARETLDRMAGGVPHQGLIAVVSAKPVLDLESLLGRRATPALVVVLDGVEDPRNLGAILRTAEAAGADGVLLPERHSAGLSETVSRASAGALEHVKVARIGNVVAGDRGAEGARPLGRGLRRHRHRALGRGRLPSGPWRSCSAARAAASGGSCASTATTWSRCRSSATSPRSTSRWPRASRSTRSCGSGGAVPSHVRPIPSRPARPRAQIVGPAADDAEHDPGRAHPYPRRRAATSAEDEATRRDAPRCGSSTSTTTWPGGRGRPCSSRPSFDSARRNDGRGARAGGTGRTASGARPHARRSGAAPRRPAPGRTRRAERRAARKRRRRAPAPARRRARRAAAAPAGAGEARQPASGPARARVRASPAPPAGRAGGGPAAPAAATAPPAPLAASRHRACHGGGSVC